jgi:hypothetical protein
MLISIPNVIFACLSLASAGASLSNGDLLKMIEEQVVEGSTSTQELKLKKTIDQLQNQPNFSDDIQPAMMVMVEKMKARRLGKDKTKNLKSKKEKKKSKSARACDPMDVELADYPQWQAERGYWIGEYTFLNGDGDAFVSGSWNYPYDHYKGFITGDISG